MAGLYLENKLRPCYVQIKKDEKKKGLFHRWNFTSNVVEPSPIINGHPGSAIVELEDGKIVCVMPNNITFADSPFKEYS